MDFTLIFKDLLEHLDYWNIAFLMMIESTVIPFPSEIVVAPAAYMAAEGRLDIIGVIIAATLGADLGATINYWVAYFVGRPLVYKFADSKLGHICLIDKEKVHRAERYFDDHGVVATLVGRLVPVIRQLISVPAGLAKMSFPKFILYTTIGAGAWNIVLAAMGWYLQSFVPYDHLIETVEVYNKQIGIGIVLICFLGLLYALYKTKRKKAI